MLAQSVTEKHITLRANGEPLLNLSLSHSLSSPVPQRFSLSSGLPTVTVLLNAIGMAKCFSKKYGNKC